MLEAGEARCAITPANGMSVLRDGWETAKEGFVTCAQSARGIVARDNLVEWESL
jgi:hypothetical protein